MTIQNDKTTAHQLWCNAIRSQIKELFYPLRPAKKTEVEQLHDKILSAVLTFETTRLRVHVDKLITELEQLDSGINFRAKEIEDSKVWQFKKRSVLRDQIKSLSDMRKAYAHAVKMLTNTPPPGVPADVKPVMNVLRETPPDHLRSGKVY